MTKVFKALAGLVAAIGIGIIPFASSAKAVEGFSIDPNQKIIVFGDGCPSGTATGIVNGNDVSIIFSRFEASATAGASSSVGCNVRLGLNVPSGYTVQPVYLGYLGDAAYTPGGSALVTTAMTWGGKVKTVDSFKVESVKGANFTGPWDRNIDVNLAAINACKAEKKGVLGVNTLLTANARNAKPGNAVRLALNTADFGLGEVIYRVKFSFNPC